jgi:hypothetical protein
MKFNKQLNEDITQLKRLRKLKRSRKSPDCGAKYITLQKKIAVKYKVTIRTVQNWLNARIPGKRKGRADAGKLRNKPESKEKKLITELIQSGLDIKDIRRIVEKRTGSPLSTRKLNNIRKLVEKSIAEKPLSFGEGDSTIGASGGGVEPSQFGDQAKQLFVKLFELDLIAPGHGVKIKVNGRYFTVPKEDVEDICLILANAYNRTAAGKLKLDREHLLRQRLYHLVEAQVRLAATEHLNSKEVASMIKQFNDLKEDIKMDANIRTVEKICKELKPDITWSEIGALIRKYTDEVTDAGQ